MKALIAFFAVCTMSLVSMPASAATLTNGVYVAKFAGGCGQLTVKGGGKSLYYKFGVCGKERSFFESTASLNGSVIKVKGATLKIRRASSDSISGQWQNGSYMAYPTFLKDKPTK